MLICEISENFTFRRYTAIVIHPCHVRWVWHCYIELLHAGASSMFLDEDGFCMATAEGSGAFSLFLCSLDFLYAGACHLRILFSISTYA